MFLNWIFGCVCIATECRPDVRQFRDGLRAAKHGVLLVAVSILPETCI